MNGPKGLRVQLLSVGGDEYAIFEWDVPDANVARQLTSAEEDVLQRIVAGASNHDIAAGRAVSVRTVANQVASVLRKLGASSRFDLIRRFGGSLGGRQRG